MKKTTMTETGEGEVYTFFLYEHESMLMLRTIRGTISVGEATKLSMMSSNVVFVGHNLELSVTEVRRY